DKTFVNIELQVSRQNYMPKRSMFYISRMFSEQMVKGQDYETLKPVIGINLLDFSLFDDIDTWHNVARFKLDNTDKILTDCMSLHFLELPKLKYSDIKKVKRLEAWGAYFSGRCSEEELEVLLMNEPLLQKAVSFEKAFLSDDKMYREYQQREDAIREETTKFNRVKREAKAEEKLETAIKFLKLGVDVNTVASGTGLSLDKVIEINRQLNK
ncbi:Rpn family recombination-promoting nuclease/putative transposase, partial [Megamonas funiformis]